MVNIMKRILGLICGLIMFLTSCSDGGTDKTAEFRYQKIEPIAYTERDVCNLYGINYRKEAGEITIADDNRNTVVVLYDTLMSTYVTHIFVYSPERKLVDYIAYEDSVPIKPITVEEKTVEFIVQKFEDIEKKYGKPHHAYYQFTNNFTDGDTYKYSPCYFTKDGYCIVFFVEEDGIVYGVYQYDLINREIVKKFGTVAEWLNRKITY